MKLGNINSKKFVVVLLLIAIWLLFGVLTYWKRSTVAEAWAFMTFLSPFIVGGALGYIGVQGYIDHKAEPPKGD